MSTVSPIPTGDVWVVKRRLEAWAGEVRVNLIRVAAILAFYGHHLFNFYVFRDPTIDVDYHVIVTLLVVAWSILAGLLFFLLRRRQMPPSLKYASTAGDLVFLTLLLLPGHGVKGPLVALYFPIIAAAALRLSLPLVYVATLGSMASYLFLLGAYAWYQVGWEEYYRNPSVRIPRSDQVILLLAFGTTGLLAGQMVRQARRLVRGYPVAVASAQEGQA